MHNAAGLRRPTRVLIADDEPGVRRSLSRLMSAAGHEVLVARDGVEALALTEKRVDLILIDAQMPRLDGFEVVHRIRTSETGLSVPIVMFTGAEGRSERLRAVRVGVSDFLTKPIDPLELRLRCTWLLKLKEAHDALEFQKSQLETTVALRTRSLETALNDAERSRRDVWLAHVDTIVRLVMAAEYKDRDTASHVTRIGAYCAALAAGAGWSSENVEMLKYASQMHDVGKLGVPDAILLKAGPLDRNERLIMQEHTVIGARILQGSPSKLLQAGEVIALAHHERWDGQGYPRGLRATDIPVTARMCAIADFYDALTSDRPYRPAVPPDDVVAMMRSERGRHFDPQLLDLFLERRPAIERVLASDDSRAG